MSLVSIQGISKKFGHQTALQPLDLEIAEGEIFGLLGHNGAGKSTTFGIMLGHIRANSGTVKIAGHDVTHARRDALSRTGAIFETPCFYDYLSGDANLDYFVSFSGGVEPARRREVVELVGLTGRMKDRVGTYSHGMRQRLALAQALLPDPEFILLDEPNDGLDPQGIIETREILQRLRSEHGKTIMFSSHILHEVEHLCDRVAILREGKMVFQGSWREATAGGQRRLQLRFEQPDLAAPVLERFGMSFIADAGWYLLPDEHRLADVSRALAAAGAGIVEFAERPVSLEDFYLARVAKEAS